MRKLDMLVANFPDTYKLTKQDEVSKTLFLSEIICQLSQAEGGQHRTEGTGKADDNCEK